MEPIDNNTKYGRDQLRFDIVETQSSFIEQLTNKLLEQQNLREQFKKIVHLTIPSKIKIKLIEGFLQNIKDMINKQTNKYINKQLSQSREEEFLWNQIQYLEKQIIFQRMQKQRNQNNMDIYYDEREEVQQLISYKVNMILILNQQIKTLNGQDGLASTVAQSITSYNNLDNI